MKSYTVNVYPDGTNKWYLNGQLHREDGAAVEYASGTKEWYLNGQLHREDGAAVEWADGTNKWYLNGQLHREDGAAVEWADGTKEWYLNGEKLTYQEFISRTQTTELTLDQIAEKFGIPVDKLKIKK
jgi:antitoxin component YwqK of YwqJK toxin-antitoxin module